VPVGAWQTSGLATNNNTRELNTARKYGILVFILFSPFELISWVARKTQGPKEMCRTPPLRIPLDPQVFWYKIAAIRVPPALTFVFIALEGPDAERYPYFGIFMKL